jgi:hypothetical protein
MEKLHYKIPADRFDELFGHIHEESVDKERLHKRSEAIKKNRDSIKRLLEKFVPSKKENC